MQSRSKLAEKKRTLRRSYIIWTLNVTCVALLACALCQTVQLLGHCGRDFRLSHLSDPWVEQLIMTSFEIAVSVAGLVGMWTRRKTVYFVVLSFFICTCMIQHFVDLLMGVIYIAMYGAGLEGVERFLNRNYKNYLLGELFSIAKYLFAPQNSMADQTVSGRTNDLEDMDSMDG